MIMMDNLFYSVVPFIMGLGAFTMLWFIAFMVACSFVLYVLVAALNGILRDIYKDIGTLVRLRHGNDQKPPPPPLRRSARLAAKELPSVPSTS